MKNVVLIRILILVLWLCICQTLSAGGSMTGQVIGQEDFDKIKDGEIPKGWWIEGGQKVGVEQGRLRIQSDPANGSGQSCTVWTEIMVLGDVQISYDALVLFSRKNVNNINSFLYYADPSGKDLHTTQTNRKDAKYALYHNMDGYIITFLNVNQNGRIRIRRCPGFKLMKERIGYHCRQGETYRITIIKKGITLTCDIDNGKFSLTAEDLKPLAQGRIGFRTWATDYWVDNLKVVSLMTEGQSRQKVSVTR